MNKYKFNRSAGALQEAYDEGVSSPTSASAFDAEVDAGVAHAFGAAPEAPQMAIRGPGHRVRRIPSELFDDELAVLAEANLPIQLPTPTPIPTPAPVDTGLDPHHQNHGGNSMFYYTVEEGNRVLMTTKNGAVSVVEGPARVWRRGRKFRPMRNYIAHPGEFLVVQYRDGNQDHLAAPCNVWFDPRVHGEIHKEEALPIADKEAVIVYSETDDGVAKRIVHGPATFVPEPGERLHTFRWHGSVGGKKVPGALEFQKLWLLPDQMYHDVADVRTADDAVLTIRLMMFFELVDIDKMLSTTHDPIGDFLNAATSDVVDFVGRHSFDSFKKHTEQLNNLETYRQLRSRAERIGYRIDRVVYRGYGAKASLEQMHDQALESRTRLQLEKATEQQTQELNDLKIERELARAQRTRNDEAARSEHELALRRSRDAEDEARELRRREMLRKQADLDAAQNDAIARQDRAREAEHLARLADLGVDLTAYLTANQADRVIELRGTESAHVHLTE